MNNVIRTQYGFGGKRVAVSMNEALRSEIQKIADKNNMSFSETARRLLVKGIAAHYVPIEKEKDK